MGADASFPPLSAMRTSCRAAVVSVVMPFRDAADTVEEAARSILAQQGVELELVAVDDGSHDDGVARLGRRLARALEAHGVRAARFVEPIDFVCAA